MNLAYEIKCYEKGFNTIAGIDEVGRGCLFGDVVAAAIIMPKEEPIEGVKDSKKLTPKRRSELYEKILDSAIAVGIGRINSEIIDSINIKEATKLAMIEAIKSLKDKKGNFIKPDYLLVDAENLETDILQESIIHGDNQCYSIACASIIAKVYRDNLCLSWDKEFPGYGIEKNKGYGTKSHRDALLLLGPSKKHRKTFLKKILNAYE